MSRKSYDEADAATYDIVDQVMRLYHNEIYSLEVKVAVTMVTKLGPEDEKIPCLKLHGAFAVAVIRLTQASQRVRLKHDIEIMIDSYHWDTAGNSEKVAIIDHELQHVEVRKGRNLEIKTDDTGKPKLRLKPDDYSLTGFFLNIQRHGIAAPEYSVLDRVYAKAEAALQANVTAQPQESGVVERVVQDGVGAAPVPA